jgi:hypothetical protein
MELCNDVDYGQAGPCGHSIGWTRKNRSTGPAFEPNDCTQAGVFNSDRERHHLLLRCENARVGTNMNSPSKGDHGPNECPRSASSPYEHRSKYSRNFDHGSNECSRSASLPYEHRSKHSQKFDGEKNRIPYVEHDRRRSRAITTRWTEML